VKNIQRGGTGSELEVDAHGDAQRPHVPVGIGVDDGGLDDVVEGDEVVGKGQPRHKLGERILPRAEEEVGEEHV
jgi:hypothetical protein